MSGVGLDTRAASGSIRGRHRVLLILAGQRNSQATPAIGVLRKLDIDHLA